MNILVLNAGSSSHKSCLYNFPDGPPEHQLPLAPPEPLWEGTIDWTHSAGMAEIEVKVGGKVHQYRLPSQDHAAVIHALLQTLWQGPDSLACDMAEADESAGSDRVLNSPSDIEAIGHRVVHGGQTYRQGVIIDDAVKAKIRQFASLAPAHNPVNLEGIEITQALLGPAVPQVAVFDTAFHSGLPEAAATYPGPQRWLNQGIRRYGFHGISHEYCAHRASQLLQQELASLKLIICHLGNGCSLAAIKNGKSIDTSMGFTPLDGLMMGSRSGSVDPGILLYLMREQGLNVDQLDQLLNKQSGLRGLSDISNDMRAVTEAAASGNGQAQLAYDVYIHRLRSGIGAMLASLGGLDVLVFTAGVGENNAEVRSQACQAFPFLGLKIDEALNQSHPHDQDIATAESNIRVLVIHTQEDWQIARTCWSKLNGNEGPRD